MAYIEILAVIVLLFLGWLVFLVVAPIILEPFAKSMEWLRRHDKEIRIHKKR